MTLSGEMKRLSQGLLEAHSDRIEAVAGLRTATVKELAQRHAAHQTMAGEQRQWLSEERAELRQESADLLQGLDAAHQTMASAQGQRLDEQVGKLRQETADLLQGLDVAHQTMAGEQRERLSEERAELRNETEAFMQEVRHAHQTLSTTQRQRLAGARQRLDQEVARARTKLRTDLHEAQQTWGWFNTIMQQRRAGKPAEEVIAVEKAPTPPAKETVTPTAVDDLKGIKGIGPGMEKRLNEAGIYTYAQLASKTPAELREALGDVGWLAKVEEWIEKARELAR